MAIPDSVRLKLSRAENHLYELTCDIGAYLDSNSKTFILNVQPSDPSIVLVEYHVICEPDRRLGVIIGDYVHNIRSALDHLACSLVENNGRKVTTRTTFPILDEQPKDKAGNPRPAGISGGVNHKVLPVIEALQPYQRGQDSILHPLSVLRELSNADKHRLLHTTATQSIGNRCALRNFRGNVIAATFVPLAKHETAIGAFQLPQPYSEAIHGTMEVEIEGADFVAINEPGPWQERPVLLVLEEIRQFIEQKVIASLEPFLDE